MASAAPSTSFKANLSYGQFWVIAYPIIIGALGTNIVNVTDTAFLGHYGSTTAEAEVALGASALGGIIYFMLVMVAVASATGIQILISRRLGEDKPHEVGSILDHALLLNFSVAIVLSALLYAAMGPLTNLFIQSDAVAEATVAYLYGRAWGLPFVFLFWCWRGFYTGIGRTRILIGATFSMAALNVVLAYGLIFGRLGLPQWGVFGAGFASACAEFVEAAVPLVYFLYMRYAKAYRAFRFRGMNWAPVRQLVELSGPMVLQNVIAMFAWFLFFIVMEHMGEGALAASNLARSLYMVAMVPCWGFGAAVNTVVSNIIGQGKQKRVLMAAGRGMTLSIMFVGLFVVGLLCFPSTVLRLYTDDLSLIAAARPIIYIIGVALLSCAFGTAMLNALTGTGATKVSFYIEVINIAIYLAYTWLVGVVWGGTMLQVWYVEPLYFFLMGLMCYLYLRSGRWRSLKV